ncbi:MAG TPA: BatA and WFA domain-containing protein [Blastocatellia bacterium]|nr:BatA and WFA domain-containing protein [Blastocatellia bacterium]
MRLLSMSALWWMLLGAIIIFFYLLKLKRNRRVMPSVMLWQRAMEELEANAPFKKLRRSLLLLLQLLALAAIVFTLARPLVTTRALASGNTIIIIDSTASMSARDESGSSRLDRAKQLAREMVDGLSRDDRAAVIESSSRVTVRSSLTSDRAALASAINEIRETDAAGNLTDALRLAEQMAKAERDAAIIIISDGANASGDSISSRDSYQTGASNSVEPRNVGLRFVRVGRRADNVAATALNARPTQSGNREMFASIANFGERERTLGVELRVDGRLVDARTVTVAANDRAGLVFDALPETGGLAELKLAVDDDLASDNVAYAFLPDARRIRIGVASDNSFLLQALAVNPDFDARKITSSTNLSDYDCVVVEGASSAGLIENARAALAINPADSSGLWQTTGEINQPQISFVDRAHLINSFLNYSDVHIESATRREAAPFLKPIVASGNDGLIFAGEDARRRVVMIGFDLAQSDLPLKIEFPILLANSIAWLAGRDALASEKVVRAGQPATIRTNGASAIVTTPSGETEEVAARDGAAIFADTLRAGLYQVKDGAPFAASLLNESESNTAPRDSIKTRAGEVTGQAETFNSEREVWRWIALIALAVLSFEWWVYHRKIAA